MDTNGYITHADGNLLNNVLLFGDPLNPSWTFIADDEAFTDNYPDVPDFSNTVEGEYTNATDNQLDFDIVKVGDVNSTCLFNVPPCCIDTMAFDVLSASLSINQVYDFPLKTNDFTEMQAFQMGLAFDPNELAFISVISGDLKNGADTTNWNTTDATQGELSTAWHHCPSGGATDTDTTLTDGKAVFYLRFKALKAISNVANSLSIDNTILTDGAYTSGDKYNIVLQEESSTGGERSAEGIGEQGSNLFKAPEAYPNPVTQELIIKFDLAEPGRVTIRINDTMGKGILEREFRLSSGPQQLRFKDVARWSNGIYYYTLDVAGISYNGKFVKAGF